MSRVPRIGLQGAAFGAALGLLLVLIFVVPKILLGATQGQPSMMAVSLIYVVGGAVIGAAAESLWPLAKRSWFLAGVIGFMLATPLMFVVGLVALESREDVVLVTLITSGGLGFPVGVGFRAMFLK